MTSNAAEPDLPAAGALRQLWLNLEQVQDPAALARRRQEHQTALEALIKAGVCEPALARQLQLAFEHATDHVERSLSFCYIAFPPEQLPRQDLLRQAALLQEAAGDLDPATVAQAQSAIARDLAFLGVGQAPPDGIGFFQPGTLEVEPQVLAAARFLAALLQGQIPSLP